VVLKGETAWGMETFTLWRCLHCNKEETVPGTDMPPGGFVIGGDREDVYFCSMDCMGEVVNNWLGYRERVAQREGKGA